MKSTGRTFNELAYWLKMHLVAMLLSPMLMSAAHFPDG